MQEFLDIRTCRLRCPDLSYTPTYPGFHMDAVTFVLCLQSTGVLLQDDAVDLLLLACSLTCSHFES
jgi:hypothetical protein